MSLRDVFQRSLQGRVMGLVLAITVLALGLSAVGLVFYDLGAYQRQATRDAASVAEVLGRASGPALSFSDPDTAARDLAIMQVRPSVRAAALYGRDGRLFATYLAPGSPEQSFPTRPVAAEPGVSEGVLEVVRPVVENGETVGAVLVRTAYDPWPRLRDYLSILALVMVASFAVAAVLTGWMQRGVTAPILEVAEVARRVVERRDYSPRVRKTTRDETGLLVDAFNAMLAEIGRRTEAMGEADRRKDEFLATLAHELRNPLAPIRTGLELLAAPGEDPARDARAREIMQRQVAQMVRLVDDLLDVSRITTGKLAVRRTPMDLRKAVDDALETARPFVDAHGHALEVRLAEGPCPVEGDRARLAQVVANLLNNAAKYTEPGGRIRLESRCEDGWAVVTVSDNGIGLDPAAAGSIFDMFVQADHSLERTQAGLGVGLTLARRFVELHGGTIEATSDGLGKGTRFTVRLPLAAAPVPASQAPAACGTAPRHGRRVLLADDNVDFAVTLAQLMALRGHEVRLAHDGAAALAEAEAFRPDVAFLDIGMPKVHGYEVARRLRAASATAGCLLVAVTGWGQEQDRTRAREAGFDRHLVKPADPAEILAILEARDLTSPPPPPYDAIQTSV